MALFRIGIGLVVAAALAAAGESRANPPEKSAEPAKTAQLSFKGKGDKPIRVIHGTGQVEEHAAPRKITYLPPDEGHAAPLPEHKEPVHSTLRDETIDEMLRNRPNRDPNRFDGRKTSAQPPKPRQND